MIYEDNDSVKFQMHIKSLKNQQRKPVIYHTWPKTKLHKKYTSTPKTRHSCLSTFQSRRQGLGGQTWWFSGRFQECPDAFWGGAHLVRCLILMLWINTFAYPFCIYVLCSILGDGETTHLESQWVSFVWSTRVPFLKGTWKRDYTSVLESKALQVM